MDRYPLLNKFHCKSKRKQRLGDEFRVNAATTDIVIRNFALLFAKIRIMKLFEIFGGLLRTVTGSRNHTRVTIYWVGGCMTNVGMDTSTHRILMGISDKPSKDMVTRCVLRYRVTQFETRLQRVIALRILVKRERVKR